jgi:hypothetical protein
MSVCTILYYTLSPTYGVSEPRCKCTLHGVEFLQGAQFGGRCPIGYLENRIVELEARIDQHEQDYYNAQHKANVST